MMVIWLKLYYHFETFLFITSCLFAQPIKQLHKGRSESLASPFKSLEQSSGPGVLQLRADWTEKAQTHTREGMHVCVHLRYAPLFRIFREGIV